MLLDKAFNTDDIASIRCQAAPAEAGAAHSVSRATLPLSQGAKGAGQDHASPAAGSGLACRHCSQNMNSGLSVLVFVVCTICMWFIFTAFTDVLLEHPLLGV